GQRDRARCAARRARPAAARRGPPHPRRRRPGLDAPAGSGRRRDRSRRGERQPSPGGLCHLLRRGRRALARSRRADRAAHSGGWCMRVVRPRALTHRGVVEASAFLVDAALAGPLEARRRILALWVPGATVYRDPLGWLIRLPSPRRVRCDRSPGLPLTAEKVVGGRALVSAPFAADELRALDPPEGATVHLHAGVTRIERPVEADRVDPASWLDVAGFQVADAATLGPPPVEPQAHPPGPVAFDPRTRL